MSVNRQTSAAESVSPFSFPEPVMKKTFYGLAGLILIVMLVFSKDFGITGDEIVQRDYGYKVLNFYTSFGKDTAALNDPEKWMHLYGGLFDATAAFINQYISPFEEYATRHFLNALVGFLAILFAGLFAKDIAGWRAGIFTMLLLALSPKFFGHSMNNPKDIPFATAYILTLFYSHRLLLQLPKPSWKVVALTGMGVALAINIRVGGLLLLAYLALFAGLVMLWNHREKLLSPSVMKTEILPLSGRLLAVAAIGFFGGLVFWPYGLTGPFSNTFKALSEFSNYGLNINQVFEGTVFPSGQLPWYYLPKFLLISNPVLVFVGAGLCLALFWKLKKQISPAALAMVLFTVFFPLFYIIYQGSNVYGEWRHVLFIYPSIAVLGGIGWEMGFRQFSAKIPSYALAASLLLLSAYPAFWMVKNHPHQYVFFNLPFGGVSAAHGSFETDYWMNSLRETTLHLIRTEKLDTDGAGKTVVTNAFFPVKEYFKVHAPEATVRYTRYYERGEKDWDYALFYSGYVAPAQLRAGTWPPGNVIYTAKADDAILSVAIKRPGKEEYLGMQAIKEQKWEEAARLLLEAAKADPKNEGALANLGLANLNLGRMEQAVNALSAAYSVHPENFNINYWLGIAYANSAQPDMALTHLLQALNLNPRVRELYNLIANVYEQKGDRQTAKAYRDQAGRM